MNWKKVSSLPGEATSDSYSRVNQPNCQLGLLCFHFPLLFALCAQCFWLEHSPAPGRHWESIQLNPNSQNEAVLSLGLDQLLGHLSPPTWMNISVGSKKPPITITLYSEKALTSEEHVLFKFFHTYFPFHAFDKMLLFHCTLSWQPSDHS